MLIDWFTVGAQIVNFLVLVYLLKRFLYGPIIKAMDEREKKIARRLEEGQKTKFEAQQELERYQEKTRELDDQHEALLTEFMEQAQARRKELTEKARKEVDAIQANWHEAIQREKESFLGDLRQRAGKHTYAIARHALKDLANAGLERHITSVFVERLRSLGEDELGALQESVRTSEGRISLRSAFEIPEDMAERIVEALQDMGFGAVQLQFESSSDVICGIEMRAHGRKIAWSIENYLEALEEELAEALEGRTKGRNVV